MWKLCILYPIYLEFEIDPKIFSFTTNFINKSCRIWNLVSSKIDLTFFWNFLQFSTDFTRQQHYSHKMIDTYTQGSLSSTVSMSLDLCKKPLKFLSLLNRSPYWVKAGPWKLTGMPWRRRSPAARGKGWGSIKGLLRTCGRLELGWGSSQWQRDGSLRPAAR
jgi:hypothetical protein